jgi:hypothetical protein
MKYPGNYGEIESFSFNDLAFRNESYRSAGRSILSLGRISKDKRVFESPCNDDPDIVERSKYLFDEAMRKKEQRKRIEKMKAEL